VNRITIDLKHCYGIKELRRDLDFSKTNAYAIYAPNGVMKSSLAQTFKGAAEGQAPEDRIFPGRKSSRSITDDSGKELEGDRVLVVLPYDEQFGPTEKTSTLLVNAALRKEYEQLHVAIDEAKESLLKAIRQQATSRRDFEQEISSTFTNSDEFELALTRIRDELSKQAETPFADVKYDLMFDDKVLKALDTQDLKAAIEGYIHRYNELLTSSTYFRKGTFDYYNAGQIAKSLAEHGFFEAKHTVNLKATDTTLEINTQKELETVISKEKEIILKDKELRKTFDSVEKQLSRNAELREFCRYLQDHEAFLSQLNNIPKFKEDVLKSYLKAHYPLYQALMDKYDAAAKRKKEIREEARKQQTQWQQVISIFNDRFFVPFQLEAKNQIEVMLGDDQVIKLGFTYIDGAEKVEVDKSKLMKVLSTGERKALYVLNVIFEIQRRIQDKQETLVVVDDIADSFDYQNKYAIIQYLKDISEDGLFKLIIMTHNFDFFRTLQSRFVRYPFCLMATKNDKGVTLVQATGIKNVFAHDWKINFFTDSKKRIASICFLRNLVEMTTGDDDRAFILLTSMLHWRPDSATITVAQLDQVFNSLCKTQGASPNPAKPVFELIAEQATDCLTAQAQPNLENKIVLAVAIRVAAERYMVARINDDPFVKAIAANQTQALIERFKKQFAGEKGAIQTLDMVALMTPENIHVNSFMYEPILDMSDDHLRKLYRNVAGLTP
jgi:energy-coupling factor transporter ATP-binding protein EcfA2